MRRSVPCPVLGPLWRSSGLWATTDPAFDGRRDAPPVATRRARRARDSQGLKPWPACSRCWLLRARWIGGPGMLADRGAREGAVSRVRRGSDPLARWETGRGIRLIGRGPTADPGPVARRSAVRGTTLGAAV